MLNKSHTLSRYEKIGGKNKKNCFMHFDLDARVFVLEHWHKIQLCDNFSSVIVICFISFSQTICLNYKATWFWWRNMFPWQLFLWKWVKYIFAVIIAIAAKRENASLGNFMSNQSANVAFKRWILQIQTTTERIKLIGYLILREINFCKLKIEHFEEKSPKSWKT